MPRVEASSFPPGGVSVWYTGPEDLDAAELTERAAKQGILVADGSRYFFPGTGSHNCLRLGFGSIAQQSIEPGIALLGGIAHRMLDETRRISG
jgi:GntR family transcriptional regulator/MocR family aminotransferase